MDKPEETIWLLTTNQQVPDYQLIEGTLLETVPDRSWIGARYEFAAQVDDVASIFGINNGRISKLSIQKVLGLKPAFRNPEIANYDCEWETKPTTKADKVVLKRIIDGLEASPTVLNEKQNDANN